MTASDRPASGQYGPRVPVTDDADTQAKLLAFIGRDPQWTPANRPRPWSPSNSTTPAPHDNTR